VLVQEIDRLQFVRAPDEDLESAKKRAIDYLEGAALTRWFLSAGIPDQRERGIQLIRSLTADDLRVTARDVLVANRVVASWSPRANQARIAVESLSDESATVESPQEPRLEMEPVALPAFPPHSDLPYPRDVPQKLPNGISIVASSRHAIFVAPDMLAVFDTEPTVQDLEAYRQYRANRILVMAPSGSLDRARQMWATFQANHQDTTSVMLSGDVTSGDIPALVLLKVILDRKLIEKGLSGEVRLSITVPGGSTLKIEGPEPERQRVLSFIREIVRSAPSQAEMTWAREAAIHRMGQMLPDLQSLVWGRDPEGSLGNVDFIAVGHVQDVARIYFQ
jgi:hypothetical protein